MLSPKRVKFRKMFKGRTRGVATRGSAISFGTYGLMALEPGDLILTGTPPGVGYFRDPSIALRSGDTVEIEVEGIGKLTNPVVA